MMMATNVNEAVLGVAEKRSSCEEQQQRGSSAGLMLYAAQASPQHSSPQIKVASYAGAVSITSRTGDAI